LIDEKLDVRGKMCPLPVAFTKHKLDAMTEGQMLEVTGEGKLEFDNIQQWTKRQGHKIVQTQKNNNEFKIIIKKQNPT
jgi:tRNA 2-thiouridine synthesizing protein A